VPLDEALGILGEMSSHEAGLVGELLQFDFPQPHPRAIRAAAVRRDGEFPRPQTARCPMRSCHQRIHRTMNSAVSLVIPTLTKPALVVISYTPQGTTLPSFLSSKSWTFTRQGPPFGR
jgi:hypothetical protein